MDRMLMIERLKQMANRPLPAHDPTSLTAKEEGGLDEYEEKGGPEEYDTGGYEDDEEGYYDDEDGGYDLDDNGGYLDDDSGGYEDDEEGGFDGDESINDFIEHGGKKKRRKKRRPLFGRPRRKKRKKKKITAAQARAACERLGYGTLELASHGTPMSAGMPYVSVSSGIRIIEAPIPMENRIQPNFLKHGLINTALRTSHSPVNTVLSPPAGPFVLNLNSAVAGQLNEAIGVVLDIGPQPLNTQAGAVMSVGVSGRYVDGDVANLGQFRFGLPSTTSQMRIVFFFYAVQNGAPRPKQMYCANGYTTPYQAAVDPVTQAIVLSGDVPAGLFLSATLLGPSQPTYENLLNAMFGNCRC